MEFSLIEMNGWPYWFITKTAMTLIFLAFWALLYYVPVTFIRARKLGKAMDWLAHPILKQLESAAWEPGAVSWPNTKIETAVPISGAVRRELSSQAPLSILEAIDKGTDILAGPFAQASLHMLAIGGGALLLGIIGVAYDLSQGFRGAAYLGVADTRAVWASIYESLKALLTGTSVALAYFGLYGFSNIYRFALRRKLAAQVLAKIPGGTK